MLSDMRDPASADFNMRRQMCIEMATASIGKLVWLVTSTVPPPPSPLSEGSAFTASGGYTSNQALVVNGSPMRVSFLCWLMPFVFIRMLL